MSNAIALIDRLEDCVETSPGIYKAKCPNHDDRSPSLSIKELDDGKVLINCYAGCDTSDVVTAIGLSMRDLFPNSRNSFSQRQIAHKKQQIIRDLLPEEKMYVLIFDGHVAAGKPATRQEVKRAALARQRIRKIERMLGDD